MHLSDLPPSIVLASFRRGKKLLLLQKNRAGNAQKQNHGFLGKAGQIQTIIGLREKGLPKRHLRPYQTSAKDQAEERGTRGRACIRAHTHALGLDAEDTARSALTSLIMG